MLDFDGALNKTTLENFYLAHSLDKILIYSGNFPIISAA